MKIEEPQAWCDSTREQLKKQIAEAGDKVLYLRACHDKVTSDADVLAVEVGDLAGAEQDLNGVALARPELQQVKELLEVPD